ncbi:hypothetical protein AAG570_009390 [Ranatra chinensis]|uniref:Uncharacterized protein n=1 Tax=Ranatra chinensis TaxID=642074 RepID=A0ABD0YNY6_9HEMI
MSDIALLPGVTLVKEKDFREGRALMTPAEIEGALPQDPEEKSSRMLDLLYDSGLRFLQSHSLTLKMPEGAPESLQRAIEEGRGKMKKKLMPILMLIGVKLAALLPLALGVIGLMALKALFVGKIAFIIAAIIAAQKFFAGGGSIASFGKLIVQAPEAWSSGASSGWSSGAASSGPYYRRSLDKPSSAHEMAYSAQVPAQYEADPQ